MSSSWPRISVVMPSLNQASYIEDALHSVLGQAYPALEIIVIDGGSTDGTVDILRRHAQHLAYWHSRPDDGQADAINKGMALANGRILCWLNADDLLLPGSLRRAAEALRPSVGHPAFVHGASICMSDTDAGVAPAACPVHPSPPEPGHDITTLDFVAQPSAFWTAELASAVGPLATTYDYAFDWEWFIRASRRVALSYTPHFLSIYRVHASQKTRTGDQKRRQEILDIVETYAPRDWQRTYRRIAAAYGRIHRTRTALEQLHVPFRRSILAHAAPVLVGAWVTPGRFKQVMAMLR